MNNQKPVSELGMVGILLLIFIFMLGLLWVVAQKPVAWFFLIVRMVESAGLFWFTPWAKELFAMIKGTVSSVPFLTVYKSSIPFGILFALLFLWIGLRAAKKVKTQSLSAFITHKDVLNWKQVMVRQSVSYPANRFFLDHEIWRFHNLETGVARLPMRAIDVIIDAGAYRGTYRSEGADKLSCDRQALNSYLLQFYGPPNPFVTSSQEHSIKTNEKLPSNETIALIVNTRLRWHHCLVLYPALKRLYGAYVDTGESFETFISSTDEFLRDVWRDLNAIKSKMGDSIVIGFQDTADESYQRAVFLEKNKGKKRLYTLAEYLDSPPEKGSTNHDKDLPPSTIADLLPTVVFARREIIKLLTSHRHKADATPYQRDPKLGLIYKPYDQMVDSEKILAARILVEQLQFVDHIHPILYHHGYISTLLAATLDERTKGARSLGVLAPAQFRWMRFYDRNLWIFLRPIGGHTAAAECAGLFQHYLDEITAQQAIMPRQCDRAIDQVITEADLFLTPELIKKLYEEMKQANSYTSEAESAAEIIRAASEGRLRPHS